MFNLSGGWLIIYDGMCDWKTLCDTFALSLILVNEYRVVIYESLGVRSSTRKSLSLAELTNGMYTLGIESNNTP